jgi:hypothetical protein
MAAPLSAARASGLREHSRAHQPCRHKTSAEIEQQVLALRRKLPTFGAARLKRELDLTVSHMAIQRIWREHGLIRKRRKKYQRKQELAAVKATWRLFQQISADTKDLRDIPQFWPQAQSLRLPLVEYTAREVRSRLLFWAFAQKRSATASAVFAARIERHLDRWGVNLRDLAWQTDNGSEFIGGHDPLRHPTGFPAALGDSQHLRIPPAANTYQTDVETVHRLEEDEFFDLESFSSRGDFLAKVHTYQFYFNLARPNSTRKTSPPGRSSSGSLLVPRLISACFHRSSWITNSRTRGDTMCLGFPIVLVPAGKASRAALRNG